MYEKINELNKLQTDEDRLGFLQKYPNNFFVYLDNDAAYISFEINYDNPNEDEVIASEKLMDNIDFHAASFDKDFGSREGVLTLFKMLGIQAKFV